MKAFIYILISASLLLNCSGGKKESAHDHTAETPATKYTCPMHPSVIQDGPGKCPICGMDLVPKNQASGDNNDLMLNESQIRLANITMQKVTLQSIGQTVVINARLVVDQDYSEVITSRSAGRVERLFFKETGRFVKKGEPLYELYSETLLTLQKEYLLAKDQYEALGKTENRYESFLKASERKLLLYGLSKSQVEQLGQSKTAKQQITFLAPASGMITEINASEGQYLSEGGMLYKIENITRLWLEAELYPQETSLVKIGDKINVRVSGYESSPVETKVTFLSPEYRANTQIVIMRAAIENQDMKFKPGTQAQVLLNHSARKTLAIPTDAVIRDGKGTHVYVESDTNTFQPRMVKTGLEDFEKVEITEGLIENEIVVVSGAYLLYSELVLKKGVSPMAGHQHDAMNNIVKDDKMQREAPQQVDNKKQTITIDPRFSEQVAAVLEPYLKMKDALVASNVKSVNQESKKFSATLKKVDMTLLQGEAHINWMEKLNVMERTSASIQTETDLEKQRALFSDLTNALYASIKMYSVNGLHVYYQYCPMAFDNKGAYWLSLDKEISNPYFGEQMLTCGETKETLK
ncbi:MAG: efflux transporter periplasmic adaptor subunit [Azospira oryzae]|nr:MAG: efflux transporter periplasmic adaptor subunit [Azospira oryzae]